MSSNLLTKKMFVPRISVRGELEPCESMVISELNSEPMGFELITVDGVNERGKTQIVEKIASTTGIETVSEPPKTSLHSMGEPTTWYDLLVKNRLINSNKEPIATGNKYIQELVDKNRDLIIEILVNSGVIHEEEEDTIFLSPEYNKFWGFVLSRLDMKNVIQAKKNEERYSEPSSRKLISDRNALTTFAFNLVKNDSDEMPSEELFLNALKIYAYLGENNYIPTSSNTFVITSGENESYVSERGSDGDVNDANYKRSKQERMYNWILSKRGNENYHTLMSKFLGDLWHIEMTHLEPLDGWEDSVDSIILQDLLLNVYHQGKLDDYICFSLSDRLSRKLGDTFALTPEYKPLHRTGDFEIITLDSEYGIHVVPEIIVTKAEMVNRKLTWFINAVPSPDYENPESIRDWVESLIIKFASSGINVPKDSLFIGSAKKAEYLGLQNIDVDESEYHFIADYYEQWGSWVDRFLRNYYYNDYVHVNMLLAALQQASMKQARKQVKRVGMTNDILPGVQVIPKQSSRFGGDKYYFPIECAINPDREYNLFSPDTSLSKYKWSNLLNYFESGTQGIENIFVANATVCEDDAVRRKFPDIVRYLFSDFRDPDIPQLSSFQAITLTLHLQVDTQGSESILKEMRHLQDKGQWKLPFGYDLGDLVKLQGVLPSTLQVNTMNIHPTQGLINRTIELNLKPLGASLVQTGFFRDFGHGPIPTIIKSLIK